MAAGSGLVADTAPCLPSASDWDRMEDRALRPAARRLEGVESRAEGVRRGAATAGGGLAVTVNLARSATHLPVRTCGASPPPPQ